MLVTWQEQFEQDSEIPIKTLNFERCLWLIMAVVSFFWLIEYRASRLYLTDTKDNVLTPAVNITLFQTKPNPASLEDISEPANIAPSLNEAPLIKSSKQAIARKTSPVTKVPHPAKQPVTTADLLNEAIHVYSLERQTNPLAHPENSNMFDSRLETQLNALRQKRERRTKKLTTLEKHSSTVDAYGDLRARAGNGCVFRRDDSGGVLDGTWYAEGCIKEETISLKLPNKLSKIPRPSFQID